MVDILAVFFILFMFIALFVYMLKTDPFVENT